MGADIAIVNSPGQEPCEKPMVALVWNRGRTEGVSNHEPHERSRGVVASICVPHSGRPLLQMEGSITAGPGGVLLRLPLCVSRLALWCTGKWALPSDNMDFFSLVSGIPPDLFLGAG